MALATSNFMNLLAKSLGDTSNKAVSIFRVAGDASYATGGSVPAAGSFGPNMRFDGIAVNISGNVTNTYQWHNDTQKLMAFVTATGAQVANAVDLSADEILLLGVVGG